MKETPKTTSPSTSAGKMKTLPAPENSMEARSLFEMDYEVEEPVDKVELTR